MLCSPHARQAPNDRRTFLRLEALEGRDCPSTLTLNVQASGFGKEVWVSGNLSGTEEVGGQNIILNGAVTGWTFTDAWGNFNSLHMADTLGEVTAQTEDELSNVAQATLSVAAPVLSAFTWTECFGIWTFVGHQSEGQLQGTTVQLSGAVTTYDPIPVETNGDFSVNLRLRMPYHQGWVTATVTDIWDQSATADTYVY